MVSEALILSIGITNLGVLPRLVKGQNNKGQYGYINPRGFVLIQTELSSCLVVFARSKCRQWNAGIYMQVSRQF